VSETAKRRPKPTKRRRRARVFASDDPSAVAQRDAARRDRKRLAAAKAQRADRLAERLAEVPQSTLDAIAHYALEMSKRRGRSLPLLRPIEEHRRKAGVPDA